MCLICSLAILAFVSGWGLAWGAFRKNIPELPPEWTKTREDGGNAVVTGLRAGPRVALGS